VFLNEVEGTYERGRIREREREMNFTDQISFFEDARSRHYYPYKIYMGKYTCTRQVELFSVLISTFSNRSWISYLLAKFSISFSIFSILQIQKSMHNHSDPAHICTSSPSNAGGLSQDLDEMDFAHSLHGAAQSGNFDKVKKRLGKGDGVDGVDSSGYAPIHYASRQGMADSGKSFILFTV
jgi:hypothetical protein